MARSIWKEPFFDINLLNKVNKLRGEHAGRVVGAPSLPSIKTWSRRSMVIPPFLGHQFDVYNGRRFVSVVVTEEMIGHKLGEFAHTRKSCVHKRSKKKK